MTVCDSLSAFADGELDTPEAYAFRDHLRDCSPCQVALLTHMQLCARLAELRPMIETGPVMLAEEAT